MLKSIITQHLESTKNISRVPKLAHAGASGEMEIPSPEMKEKLIDELNKTKRKLSIMAFTMFFGVVGLLIFVIYYSVTQGANANQLISGISIAGEGGLLYFLRNFWKDIAKIDILLSLIPGMSPKSMEELLLKTYTAL